MWWIKSFVEAFQNSGGKFLCTEQLSNADALGSLIIKKLHPVRYTTVDHYHNTMTAVGTGPVAGTLAITDILKHDIKSAYITGFPS